MCQWSDLGWAWRRRWETSTKSEQAEDCRSRRMQEPKQQTWRICRGQKGQNIGWCLTEETATSLQVPILRGQLFYQCFAWLMRGVPTTLDPRPGPVQLSSSKHRLLQRWAAASSRAEHVAWGCQNSGCQPGRGGCSLTSGRCALPICRKPPAANALSLSLLFCMHN